MQAHARRIRPHGDAERPARRGAALEPERRPLPPGPRGHDFSEVPVRARSHRAGKGGRLADEGPPEGVFGDGGVATAAPAKAPTATPPATPPKLSKKTVAGPTAKDCGGFDWVIQWQLDRESAAGGWVVQKVELPYHVTDCANKAADPTRIGGPRSSKYPFWEAWQVHKGQKVTTYAEHGDVEDDTFDGPELGADTQGDYTAKGTAEFYEGLDLPADFKVTGKAPAFSLRSTMTSPSLAGGTGSIAHGLKASWDCCGKDPKADKKTKIETV